MGGNIETFDIAFGEDVSLYVNEEGLFTCPPNRAIFATEEMAKAGYLSQLDYSKVVEMGDFYTVLNGDIVAVGFDPETGESRSLTDGEMPTTLHSSRASSRTARETTEGAKWRRIWS